MSGTFGKATFSTLSLDSRRIAEQQRNDAMCQKRHQPLDLK
jgi:hypothetical protein